jgi:hypothetical protein
MFVTVDFGHRHRRGLGVPQSDASAVLFLQQPAKQAASPPSLPSELPVVGLSLSVE